MAVPPSTRRLAAATPDHLPGWWDEFRHRLPLGLAPLVIVVATLLSGLYLLVVPGRPAPPKAGADSTPATVLRVWTFAAEHRNSYLAAKPGFERAHPGVIIDPKQFDMLTVTNRLRSAMWSLSDVPELVDIEISTAGTFFRGPSEQIGFLDLRPRLEREGLLDRIVRTRFAPYSHRGAIYGLPHDVHPVLIAYRRDLFARYGIDPAKLATWDGLIAEARRLRVLTRNEPGGGRFLIQLPDATIQGIETILFQCDGGYFDAQGALRMDDEIAATCLEWYVPLVCGPDAISVDFAASGPMFNKALRNGDYLACLAPDWKAGVIERDTSAWPELRGNMALIPMPAMVAGGRRTSTWGGTMMAITKASADHERCWQLLKHLYVTPESWDRQWRETGILPPVKESWSRPAFQERSEYWSGQQVAQEYARVADQVPPQYAHPFVTLAKSKFTEVLSSCVARYKARGRDGFGDFVRADLRAKAAEVRQQMARNPF